MLDVLKSEQKLNSWTGIPTFAIFDAILTGVLIVLNDENCNVSTLKTKILVVFVKMKTNMKFCTMSAIFSLHETTLSRQFKAFLPILRVAMSSCIYFPVKEEIRCNLPKSFKPDFVNVRAVLDCTEIPIEMPKCANCRISTYSRYKGTNTVKFLVSVTPAGTISFVSVGYTGKSSDKFIFNDSNLIENFEENVDAIMVDRGFAILEETQAKGLTLVRPTFSSGCQFAEEVVFENTKVSAARVHVERAIQRIKIFSILQDRVEHNMLCCISDIFLVISAFVNLTKPILKDNRF